jgi:L-fuculose-phosphate aldolase
MTTETALQAEAVANAYREVARRGLVIGAAGNVSLRAGPNRMLITGSGASADEASAEDVVAMSFDGTVEPGSARARSSEWAMHAAIYRAHEAAGAIVHTHSDACTALACLNEGLPAFHYMIAAFGGDDVRCAPYVTFGTEELAEVCAKAIEGRSAVLLANHGMTVHGRNLSHAVAAAQALEGLARQYLLARSAGTPRVLTAEEMAGARKRFETYGDRAKRHG